MKHLVNFIRLSVRHLYQRTLFARVYISWLSHTLVVRKLEMYKHSSLITCNAAETGAEGAIRSTLSAVVTRSSLST